MIRGGQFWELLKIDENNPEYELYKSLVEEFTEISGWPVWFYKKLESEVIDSTYGEDANAKYTEAYETKLIYEPTEETNLLDSFGITSDETIQYMQIPKSLFIKNIVDEYKFDYDTEEEIIPSVGDVIRTLWNNKLYEIIEVGSEQKIFQGRKMIWEMITRPYRHSQESDSAEDMLFDNPDEIDFPDINTTTETDVLSAYGDNEDIEEQSTTKTDTDTSIYGF